MSYSIDTQRFTPPALNVPAVPSDEVLAKRGIRIRPISGGAPCDSQPVRLIFRGEPCGVFSSRRATGAAIKQLSALVVLVVAVVLGSPVAAQAASSSGRLLAAIATVENSHGRVGAAGEIYPWQLTPASVSDRVHEFRLAGVRHATGEQLAEAHLRWIVGQLRSRGVDVIPFNVALCWNAGVERALSGKARVSSYRYAARVCAVLEASR